MKASRDGQCVTHQPCALVQTFSQAGAAAAGVFWAARCIPAGVSCFSSDNPVNGQLWPSAIKHNHVVVMTAQAFLNLLEDRDATLQTFDLMVS